MADIPATDPVVIPETVIPGKTFDIWVMPFMSFTWTDPEGPLIGDVTLQIARRVPVIDPETEEETGSYVEWGDKKVNLRVDNIWQLAAEDEDVAAAIGILRETIAKIAADKGLL